jgi:Spx/MgsR family transcriptional regulator
MKLYGIKNCDTIKKARLFLDNHAVEYQFHDYRVDGIDEALVQHFLQLHSWEQLINTRGTTWRGLPDSDKTITDAKQACQLMVAHPAIIKRPLLIGPEGSLLGFNDGQYRTFLGL